MAAVVLLTGFLTAPGECLLDVEPTPVAERYRQLAQDGGDGWLVRPSPAFLTQWGVPERLRGFIEPRLTDFPLRCATDRMPYDPLPLQALERTYVWHTSPELPSLAPSRDVAVADGWKLRNLASSHDMMLADPRATVELLEEVAPGGRVSKTRNG